MAVSFGTPTHADAGANSLTVAHTVENVGGDRMLLVVAARDDGIGGGWTVTYGGTAMSLLSSVGSGNNGIQLWYLLDPPVGTANVAVTTPGAVNSLVVMAVVAMGVELEDPFDDVQTATGASPISDTVASDVSQTVIACAAGDDVGGLGDMSPLAGQTQIDEWFHATGTNANNCIAGISYEQGAASVTSGYNISGGGSHELIVAGIRAAALPRGRLAAYQVGFWDPELVLRNNEGADVPANEVSPDAWLYTKGLDYGHPVLYDSFVDDPSKSRIVETTDRGGRLDLKANKSQFARIIIERARGGV